MEYQREAFERLLGPVDLVCNSFSGPILNSELSEVYPVRIRRLSPLNHYVLFYLYVRRVVDLGAYDFVYVRYPFALPSFLWFLRQVERVNPNAKIIVEIATYPYRHELQTFRQKVLGWLDDLGAGRLKYHVDAIVTFYGQSQIHGIPCIRSNNGIDVDALPLRRPISGGGLSLVAVGNLAERHGVDRAIRGIAEDTGEHWSETTLHVVGDGPALRGLRALAEELGVEAQVQFHGMLTGQSLDQVFDRADGALDSLGIHRLALPSSSSLKAREYCARGIPFVLAGEDPDFPDSLDFVLRVPSDESPLDIARVRAFVERNADEPGLSERMRSYAESRLTWDAKLAPVARLLGAEEARGS